LASLGKPDYPVLTVLELNQGDKMRKFEDSSVFDVWNREIRYHRIKIEEIQA
jgi:hypothetical protein